MNWLMAEFKVQLNVLALILCFSPYNVYIMFFLIVYDLIKKSISLLYLQKEHNSVQTLFLYSRPAILFIIFPLNLASNISAAKT